MQHWDNLVEEVRTAGDQVRVCISNETFAAADDTIARRIVDDFGSDDVHVIATVRRLDKLLPSHWQERVKWRTDLPPYDDWLKVMLSDTPDGDHWEHFWKVQDFEALINRWVGVTSPDRMTLIIADEDDRELLPRTFEQLLGLPQGIIKMVPDRSNRSISLNEARFLQAIDRGAAERDWPVEVFDDVLKRTISRTVRTSARRGADIPITTPPWALERIQELNERRVEQIRASGVRMLGNPSHLDWHADVDPSAATSLPTEAASVVDSDTAARVVTAAIEASLEINSENQARVTRELSRARAVNDRLRARLLRLEHRNSRPRHETSIAPDEGAGLGVADMPPRGNAHGKTAPRRSWLRRTLSGVRRRLVGRPDS